MLSSTRRYYCNRLFPSMHSHHLSACASFRSNMRLHLRNKNRRESNCGGSIHFFNFFFLGNCKFRILFGSARWWRGDSYCVISVINMISLLQRNDLWRLMDLLLRWYTFGRTEWLIVSMQMRRTFSLALSVCSLVDECVLAEACASRRIKPNLPHDKIYVERKRSLTR